MERMSVTLSIVCAIIGMCSPMLVPGILVLMGLNSPRMLAGASGLGSQMSMWLGPPCRKIMMTFFALPKPRAPAYFLAMLFASAAFWERKKPGR